jgi:hypothetical protein
VAVPVRGAFERRAIALADDRANGVADEQAVGEVFDLLRRNRLSEEGGVAVAVGLLQGRFEARQQQLDGIFLAP